ncbi:MAG: DUF3795 domain-containing protein [Candidatus Cloacimonadaceae bacterium]|nr:DUF3795 domain-containing protein [Candidatus Cloacimonadaceae bacterium]
MSDLLSACGLDCPGCECFVATKNNDSEARKDIAIRWSQNYNAELKAEDINCEGCMSDGARFSWCGMCPIRACVVAKGFENCSQCESFPCETNEFLYNAVPAAKEAIVALRN